MNVPSMNNFPSLSNKSPTKFLKFNFHILLTKLHYFLQKKETLNFRILKCGGERKKILTLIKR